MADELAAIMWLFSGYSCGPQPPESLGACPGIFTFTPTLIEMLPNTLFLSTAAITARVTCSAFSRIQQTSFYI